MTSSYDGGASSSGGNGGAVGKEVFGDTVERRVELAWGEYGEWLELAWGEYGECPLDILLALFEEGLGNEQHPDL